ncbi:DUF4268 domain-containing protein [Arenibacter sp. 6A1]|uniref:DUF4268 domain-containing protein n=1 Tax=Arenibacter sp. 6A1 TaxID=2720391 RepID=UPI00144584EB|nr:DUF4268 domain-containing protein [Arenibacter sp. 6A1]NKI27663.1 DUF4268 domain-containing protein [Arenibacter sp. 6A1]
MFSKEESKRLRQEFWISFGKSFPRKWILYQTKIKDCSFKFHFDVHTAMVSIDIETQDLEKRIELWEKFSALQNILKTEYLPEVIFEEILVLENGKEISRIFVRKENVSIHNKKTWQETMVFLKDNMSLLEAFFEEYKDMLQD